MSRNVLVSAEVSYNWRDLSYGIPWISPVVGVDCRVDEIVSVPAEWFMGDEFDPLRTGELVQLAFGDKYYYIGDNSFDVLSADPSRGLIRSIRVEAI